MAAAIQMPKLSDTMTEGVIQKWLVKEGAAVRAGDPIAEVETDKATLEMEAYESGTILKIISGDGSTAQVGAVIAVIGKPGEDWRPLVGKQAAAQKAAPTEAPKSKPERASPAAAPKRGGASAVQMPKLSDTMTEGVIQKWLVKEGDAVKAGDPIAEVETDKATLEMEAYESGTVLQLIAKAGAAAQVGAAIAVIGPSGADWRSALGEAAPAPQEAAPREAPKPDAKGEKVAWKPSKTASPTPRLATMRYPARTTSGELPGVTYGFGHGLAMAPPSPRSAGGLRVRASPLARKLAEEKGIDLADLEGTGPAGRVIKADVEGARPARGGPVRLAAVRGSEPAIVPMSQMRKAIARNLQQAKRDIPHFYLTLDVDMGRAVALRAQAKASGVSLSLNDLVLKAVALGAMAFPRVQGQLVDESTVSVPREVHLGFAVALEDGLITPVIRHADSLPIGELSRAAKELAEKARDKKLRPEEYQGGTITVSNLGMLDIEHFYAIVNPPQASIVSVGKVREEPVVANGAIVIGQRMRLGYAGDHRIVDGAVGAQFLQAVKRILEEPLKMLVG